MGRVGTFRAYSPSTRQDGQPAVEALREHRHDPRVSDLNRLVVVVAVRLLREGLCSVLAREPGIEIVASARNWREAASVLAAIDADTAILDLDVPDPVPAVAGVRRSAPRIRVIGMGIADRGAEIVALAEAGLAGYVTREEPIVMLLEVIDSVKRGEFICSRDVAGALVRRVSEMASRGASDADSPQRLTCREREILVLIERGYTNKQISRELSIEVPTVKNHVHNLLEKLEVSRRGQAAAMARKMGSVT